MITTNSKFSLVFGALVALLCIVIAAQAQYNTYDSDSNSDSEGGPILTNAELGKLVRGSSHGRSGAQLRNLHNQQQQQQLAASRNLYNKQQALQYSPSQSNRRQFNGGDLSAYNPLNGAASNGGRGESSNSDDDDGEGGNFGPNFGANFDGGDESNNEGGSSPMNLNQAASGYPGQSDYSENAGGFAGFGGQGYGPVDGSEFEPSGDAFGHEGRRAKSASSYMGVGIGDGDSDAGAPQYGPNSAINAGESDDEGRSGYAPEASNDNSNDDDE